MIDSRALPTEYVKFKDGVSVRIVKDYSGKKLAVVADVMRAIGYGAKYRPDMFSSLGLTSDTRYVYFNTRKRGICKAHCLDVDGIKVLLASRSNDNDFNAWLLGVMSDSKKPKSNNGSVELKQTNNNACDLLDFVFSAIGLNICNKRKTSGGVMRD